MRSSSFRRFRRRHPSSTIRPTRSGSWSGSPPPTRSRRSVPENRSSPARLSPRRPMTRPGNPSRTSRRRPTRWRARRRKSRKISLRASPATFRAGAHDGGQARGRARVPRQIGHDRHRRLWQRRSQDRRLHPLAWGAGRGRRVRRAPAFRERSRRRSGTPPRRAPVAVDVRRAHGDFCRPRRSGLSQGFRIGGLPLRRPQRLRRQRGEPPQAKCAARQVGSRAECRRHRLLRGFALARF